MNTQTQVEIKKAEVGLIEKMNKLLPLIDKMQSNMNKMYARIKKLEERDNGQR